MLTQAQVDNVKALLSQGFTDREVAQRVGVGRTTVQRIWNGQKNKKPPKQPTANKYLRVPRTADEYAQIRRDAIAAMEQKLARKREALA